jgi:hypothetical protein
LKTGQAILTTAALLVGYNLFAKSQAAERLNFYPASVTNIRFDGLTPVLTLGLAVQNVSNQRFVVRSIAANLSANGYIIGNLAFFLPQTIQPNSSSTLMLDIRLSLISIVNDVISAFQTENFSQDLLLQGWVNVDGIQAPLSMKYKVGR